MSDPQAVLTNTKTDQAEVETRVEATKQVDVEAQMEADGLEPEGSYDPRKEQPADAFLEPFTSYRMINGSFDGGLSLFSAGMESKIDLARHEWFEFEYRDDYKCVGRIGQGQDATNLFRRAKPQVESLKLPLPMAGVLDLIFVDEAMARSLAEALVDCLPTNVVIAYPMRQGASRHDYSTRYMGYCPMLSHVTLDQINELCGEVDNLFRDSKYIKVCKAGMLPY